MRHAAMLWGNVKRELSKFLTKVFVGGSLTGTGTEVDPIELKGDAESPGNKKYYGTDGSGNKGYHNLPEGGGGGSFDITDGTITKTIDNEDTVHFKAGSGISITVSENSGDSTKKEVEIKATGGGGSGGDENPELHIDFDEAGDEFVYPIPYKMRFLTQVSENGDATLDVPLNTTLERYDRLTVTATAGGLISLYGEYVDD